MSSRVVVLGGGAAGLLTADILGRSGHHVVVIERDAEPPLESDDATWDQWERPGVTQLRQPHGVLPGGLDVLATEVPELFDELMEMDTVIVDIADHAPEGVDRADLPDLSVIGIRRTTFERRLRAAVVSNENIDFRWGTELRSISVQSDSDLPIVTGVETTTGTVSSDLVIDATGRRTSIPQMLSAHGIGFEQTQEPDGFTYFSRWFHVPQDLQGQPIGMVGMVPGIAVLQFPSDGHTVGIALVASMSDKPVRRLRDPETFMRLVEYVPPLAALLDKATPITDVIPMGSIQNRSLRLATDGRPTVAGIMCLGDSAISTNPSLGRGISLAARLATKLRDRLMADPDPTDLAFAVDRDFAHDQLAWLTDAIHSDRRLRDIFDAARTNTSAPQPSDPRTMIARAAALDAEIWTEWAPVFATYRSPAELTSNDDVVHRAAALANDVPPTKFLMTREQVEQVLAR